MPTAQTEIPPVHHAPRSSLGWARPVVAAFALLGLLITFIVTLDFGPDEPQHLEYVHILAYKGRLPAARETHIVQHPPLYYALMAIPWRLLRAGQSPLSVTPGPKAMAQTQPSAQRARRVLRALQVLMACVSLVLMARILNLLQVPPRLGVLWLGAVAAWPMFGSISAVVNNENAAILFSCFVCFLLVRQTLQNRCSTRQAAIFGLLCGAGVLVKQTTMFVWPIALWCVWNASVGSQTENRADENAPQDSHTASKNALVFALSSLVLGVPWPLLSWFSVGTAFPSFTTPKDQFALPLGEKILESPGIARLILETSFLPDWASMYLPRELSLLMVCVVGAAMALLFGCSARVQGGALESRNVKIYRRLQIMSVASLLALLAGILQYVFLRDYAAQIGGRYLLNGLPWLLCFCGASLMLSQKSAASNDAALASFPRFAHAVSAALLVLLILISAGWWLVAWTQYQALLNTA